MAAPRSNVMRSTLFRLANAIRLASVTWRCPEIGGKGLPRQADAVLWVEAADLTDRSVRRLALLAIEADVLAEPDPYPLGVDEQPPDIGERVVERSGHADLPAVRAGMIDSRTEPTCVGVYRKWLAYRTCVRYHGFMSTVPEAFSESPSVAGFEELLDAFLAPGGPDLTDGECGDGMVGLDRVRNMADAAMCAGVDRFDANLVFVGDGMRSTVAWLRSHTELSHGQASQLIHRARALRVMPVIRAAYGHGVIGSAKVDAFADARVGVEDLFAEHEAEVLDEVRRLNAKQTRIYLARWRRVALASLGDSDDGPEPAPEDRNRFHCSESGGRYKLNGDLDEVSGAKLAAALDGWVDTAYRSGAVTRADAIRRSRLDSDALMALVENGAEPGIKQGRARPSVTVNLDLAELLGLPIDGPADVWRRVCEIAGGLAIARCTAERLMCEADVTTVLTDTGLDGIIEPLGAVHQKRAPLPNERVALAVRDKGCVFPGCDAPVDWTDAHHIDEWHLHERTELGRLVLLCRYHHHAVHEGGHSLDRTPNGAITVTRPDGTLLGPVLPGHLIDPAPELPSDREAQGASPPQRRPPTRFRPLAERRSPRERTVQRERGRMSIVLRNELRVARRREFL